jgi:hypothetical protein
MNFHEACQQVLDHCRLRHDRYVRIDDGRQYPQLCEQALKVHLRRSAPVVAFPVKREA